MFEKAVIFATNAHNGQTRKGTNLPFIIHPLEVAAIVAAMTLDEDMLCAAVLHDVVEDCDDISIEDIRHEFGDVVASYVYQESEDKSKTWVERKGHTIDFLKIKNGELGAVNFNNMIPVKSDYYSIIDLNQSTLTLNEAKYQKLLKEQLAWLNANYIQVKDKSYKLYTLYNKGKLPETMRERCCNFKLLEEKCLKYTIIDRSLHG